jgi:hypothetical protein
MDITEFESLDPTRVDAVGSPANGISFLLLKATNPQEPHEQESNAGGGEEEDGTGGATKETVAKFVEAYCGDEECEVCKARLEMLSDEDALVAKSKLSAADRKKIPKGTFAIPEKAPGSGSYPIKDKSHARNALSRASGKPVESRVRAAVHRKYPTIGDDDDDKKSEKAGAGTSHTDPDSEVWAHLEDTRDALSEAMMDQQKDDAEKNMAPNKSVPKGEALSQTHEIDDCDMAPGPGGPQEGGTPSRPGAESSSQSRTTGQGDLAPNRSVNTGESLTQTHTMNKTERAARELISATEAVFRLGHNEKTTAKAVADLTRSLTASGLIQPAPEKEILQMTKDELFNLLDERDSARRQAEKKAQKKARKAEAKKAAKQAAKAAAAEEAAKGEGAEAPPVPEADPAIKSAVDNLAAQLEAVRELVTKPPMPYLNASAIATRGQDGSVNEGDAFKGLRDRMEAETTERKREGLAGELLRAQAIAAERIRVAGGARPGVNNGPVPVVLPG